MAGRLHSRQRRTIVASLALVAAMVPLFTGRAGAVQFCNTTPIVFTPPSVPTQAVLPLAPYPSTINVTGLTGVVTDVNVTFNDIGYTRPEDLDVLLVAPNGTTLIVMSDIGGDNVFPGEFTEDVNLTFDDQSGSLPPPDSQLVSGTFRPLDDDDDVDEFVPDHADTFPAPAPAPGTATTLSTFVGVPPNGTWSLYVVDDQPGPPNVDEIGGGWCIDITTTGTATTVPPTTTPTNTCDGRAATITGTSDGDRIVGTAGPDVIVGGGGNDQIFGLGGDDVICGQAGNDVIYGDDGNDRLFGGDGTDRLNGGNGNDLLDAGPQADQCIGGPGTDSPVACESVAEVP